MRTTQAFSITLPLDMAEMVKAKVASGEYATESEVIRDGLRTLVARGRRRGALVAGGSSIRIRCSQSRSGPFETAS